METPAMNGKGSRLIPALLAAAAFCAYLGVIATGDLEWVYDDVRFIGENPAIQDLSNAGRFFTDPTTIDRWSWAGIYRPLRTLDWALDWSMTSGFSETGRIRWFHIRNVLYHVIGVLLAFGLFRKLGAGKHAAGLGALVFAIHPIQVESVAWITSRADVMCLVFFLAALHFHLDSRGADRKYLLALLFLLIALFSKEAALTFPVAAALTDFLFRDGRRFRVTLRRWWVYGSYFVLVGLYIGLWIHIHKVHEGNLWEEGNLYAGIPGQLLTMARGFVYYLRLILLPVDLAQDFYIGSVKSPDLLTLLCAALILGIVVIAIRRAIRVGGSFAFAVLWFLIVLFPASNLVVPIGIPTADRFVYLPMIGFALLAGTLLARFAARGRVGVALVTVTLVCLFSLTFSRSFVWATKDGLWESASRYDSPRAIGWWADRLREEAEQMQEKERELRDKGNFEEAMVIKKEADEKLYRAIDEFERSVVLWEKILPNSETTPYARSNQAICYYDLGLHGRAFEIADRAVRVAPKLPRAWFARALAQLGLGRLRAAAADIDRSLELRPSKPQARAGAGIYEKLAEFYQEEENPAATYRALRRSWELLPDEKENYVVWENLDRANARFQGLRAEIQRELDRDPTDGDALARLASLYAVHGDYKDAKELFDSLRSHSEGGGSIRILHDLALYYWQWRDTEQGYREAARIWQEILKQDPGNTEAETQLRICTEELRRFEEAR